MPTSTSLFDKPIPATKRGRATPLPVLARIPPLTVDSKPAEAPAAEPLATTLTHFEYLLGEFGMGGEIDTDSLSPNPRPHAPESHSCAVPAEHAAPKTISSPSAVESTPKRDFDWSELLLRLDSIVEPYTRAIVVLVVVAVGAFTMLLLRNSESSLPPQTAPAPATFRPLSKAASAAPNPKLNKATLSAIGENSTPAVDTKPTASGPIGMRTKSEPPVGTLGADIRPVPSDFEHEPQKYPSVALKPPNDSQNAQLPEGEKPTTTLK